MEPLQTLQTQIADVVSLGLAHAVQFPSLMQRAHRHNEVEFNFIEAGAMSYLYGSTQVRVSEGQLALFWATIPHQVIQVESATIAHWITIPFDIFLQWQLSEPLTQQIILGKFVNFPGYPLPHHLTQTHFKQWHADLQYVSPERQKIVLLEVEAYLRRLVLALPEPLTSHASHLPDETRLPTLDTLSKVEQMVCYIADQYPSIQHVEEVAHSVHLHPNYAMSLFRKQLGVSIGDYINQYRLAHAQRLLITTNATTSSIALDAGFGSVSRFYTIFKKSCGQSPGSYRSHMLSHETPPMTIS